MPYAIAGPVHIAQSGAVQNTNPNAASRSLQRVLQKKATTSKCHQLSVFAPLYVVATEFSVVLGQNGSRTRHGPSVVIAAILSDAQQPFTSPDDVRKKIEGCGFMGSLTFRQMASGWQGDSSAENGAHGEGFLLDIRSGSPVPFEKLLAMAEQLGSVLGGLNRLYVVGNPSIALEKI